MLILAGRVLRDSSEAKAEYSLITHDMHPSDKDIELNRFAVGELIGNCFWYFYVRPVSFRMA